MRKPQGDSKASSIFSIQEYLKGVGPRLAQKLAKLGIHSVADLLLYFPVRYEDRTRLTPIAQLKPGARYAIEGYIKPLDKPSQKTWSCLLVDQTGEINLRFFSFFHRQVLQPGTYIRCFGEIRTFKRSLEMTHPEYERIKPGAPITQQLTPIYSTTEGVSQRVWHNLIGQALDFVDLLFPDVLKNYLPANLIELATAIRLLHRPPADSDLDTLSLGNHPAQQRLIFEELLAHQLSLKQSKFIKQQQAAPALYPTELVDQLKASLPFHLTQAQERVLNEIQQDLTHTRPMMRLLQGDVGSGKTIIAALAALQALAQGYQVALMAPTELLAEQHLKQFKLWLEPLGISIIWLSGSLKSKLRKAVVEQIAAQPKSLVLGTHALFQESVQFANLGLIIIDEQHRFGVHQRLALRNKAYCPHQLIMTATPIPRTLAMTAYADLDCSVLDELPSGRKPVQTLVLSNHKREEVIERIRQSRGHQQTYWVCPLIEDSELIQAQAAESIAKVLTEKLSQLRIGLIHGQLPNAEKEITMRNFKEHQLDLLVATTVIEVGVNIPNASLMVIENAERLGLAALHQLRGRVGRGNIQSYCILLYQAPLSLLARKRLQAMRESQDGFYLAEYDLKLRGPGELLGSKQAGLIRFHIADLNRDEYLLTEVHQLAEQLLAQQADCIVPLVQRWIKSADQYLKI